MLSAAVLGLGVVLAQAQPAPVPDPAPNPPTSPVNALGVFGRFGYRVGSEGSQLGPAAGFSIGGTFTRRYAHLGDERWPGVDLAVGLDFFHDQFSSNVEGSELVAPGMEQLYEARRLLTQTSFAAVQTIALPLSRTRLWAAGGAGMTIAHFSTPERALRPGDQTAVQPLVRAAVGLDVTVKSGMGVCLRGDYTHTLTRPSFTTETGQTLSLFGDLLDIGVGLFYRF
ncbi:MAG TPA: hypothetical protein VFH73_00975 [Polyangia bacterium]|jgi:hypothetical protein|nr:hypothetical protein [Polyangia bacterium]